jgi:hypothetical protein
MVRRILVTGSRDWRDAHVVSSGVSMADTYCLRLEGGCDGIELIHGGCPQGADAMADDLWRHWMDHLPATHLKRTIRVLKANWEEGRIAGPRRNRRMVDEGPDICLAFILNESRGATGCADMAEEAGILTVRFGVKEVTNG